MNNNRVRIYELSKELNLDNKELLAICDQLDIAVKSHSSTITEPEAEQIRSAAEKQAVASVGAKKESSGSAPNPRPNTPPNIGNRARPPVVPHKQQILEIRKPIKPVRSASLNPTESQTANTTSHDDSNSVSPPRPGSPAKPSAPVRSVNRSSESVDLPVPSLEQPAPAIPHVTPTRAKPAGEATPVPRAKVEKPQLSGPPSRPADPSAPANVSERPLLKRDQVKPTINKPSSTEQTEPAGGVRRSAPVSRGEPGRRPSAPAPSPVSELQRPSRPMRPEPGVAMPGRPRQAGVAGGAVDGATSDDEETDGATILDPDQLLKRPVPRPVKGGKKWQEEEIIDEGKDAAKGKAAAKGKRVKPIVDIEDEEDLLDDDIDSQALIQVSLSVARPPKPKSTRAPVAATISSPAAAIRGRKSGSSSRERAADRRREPDQKRERPEKVVATGTMTVQELSEAFAVADTEIVKILFMKGMAVSITQNLDLPTMNLVAKELEVELEIVEPEAEARKITEMLDASDLEHLIRRPPVVTIMGHVDHGKTTLLDSIRKTKVAQGEAGGITQHIGAYHVNVEHEGQDQKVVFLDTPGHEAFTAMRARGARVTDIAILVVAADDGVRPQTVEAISHAQAAGVPIIVAINKIDKEGAQADRVKQELTQYNLTPEEWGGDTIMVPVSALKGENLDTLLEMILLVSEVEDLYANPDRVAKGTVIEAHLDKAKGAVATLLVQNGTLHVGDMLVAGSAFGKVRAMVDDRGKRVDIAGPSFAVEVLGLSDVPAAGDDFEVYLNEKEARSLAGDRADKQRQSRLMQGRVTLTTLSAQAQEGDLKELNLILKGDVQGSVEAIVGALKQIPQNEVQIRMLLSTAGEVTETDIDLAAASNAVIIAFNTTFASGARQAADEAGIDVREYNIIYKLLEDIQGALEGLLEPELVEESLGIAEVRAVFPVGRGAVAGCYVQSGKLVRNCKVRVRRNSKIVYDGSLDSLKRMKEDVRDVNSGYECGIGVDKFNDWVMGDSIEGYLMVTKRRTLTLTNK